MRGLKFLLKALFTSLILVSIAAVIGIVGFGLEQHPLVTSKQNLSHKDVERAKRLLKQNDPDKLKQDSLNTLAVSERDLNLLLSYGLSRVDALAGQVDLNFGNIMTELTLSFPKNRFGSYLNMFTSVTHASDRLQVERFRIGKLNVAPWLINPVLTMIHKSLLQYDNYQRVLAQVDSFNLSEDKLVVTYRWRKELKDDLKSQARALLISDHDKTLIKIYEDQLIRVSSAMPKKSVSLASLMDKLFLTAKKRTENGSSAKDENRALILALAMYVNGTDVNKFLGEPSNGARSTHRRLDLRLRSRSDLAQHFLVSAAITVSANSGIADAIGLFKEIDDSKGGSGFSFADLAADKAGVRFAQIATGSNKQATAIQARMSKKISETDFMPRIDRLPESIMELEFKKHYREVGTHEYELVETEINRRIADCRIYL